MKELKADFHIHTCYSGDSDLTPELIIKTALEKKINILGIVDHNGIKGPILVKKLVEKKSLPLLIFIGEEIKTKEGEIIALDIKEKIKPHLSLKRTISLIKKQNGTIVLPHPYDFLRTGINPKKLINQKLLPKKFIIESYNARSLVEIFNNKAERFAKNYNIPIIGASDAHFKEEIGNVLNLIFAKFNKESILNAVFQKKIKIIKKNAGILPHFKTTFKKFLNF